MSVIMLIISDDFSENAVGVKNIEGLVGVSAKLHSVMIEFKI